MKRGKRKVKGAAAASTPNVVGDPFESGIELVTVWMTECRFKDSGFKRFVGEDEEHVEANGDQIDVDHEAEVWFNEAETEAIVRLTVTVIPESQPSFQTSVSYAGHYRASETPKVALRDFAWSNGMAYLVPFVREKIASLTQSSFYSPVYLQPFNLSSLADTDTDTDAAPVPSLSAGPSASGNVQTP